MVETATIASEGEACAIDMSAAAPGHDFTAYVKDGEDGTRVLHLLVEGISCGACVARIEKVLARQPDVVQARVNMTTSRLVLAWKGDVARANELTERVERLGFRLTPYDPAVLGAGDDDQEKALLRALAVAGFAAGNVMLLSVSVWAGAFSGMGPGTRGLLHWVSALIALPALVYAGRPFFASALGALKGGRVNMDVPISLALVLTGGMSLFETIRGGEHAYFDSAITLTFFLLIGRYLDKRARGKARSAAQHLVALGGSAVTVIEKDGTRSLRRPEEVKAGDHVLVAAGERLAVDGRILSGAGDIDTSLITGESVPQRVTAGDTVFAGTLNLTAPIQIEVTATGEGTLLAEIVRLMEVAEQGRARYVLLADRVARFYAPVVHGLALLTFLGWLLVGGVDWQVALLHAIAVLIITCPCALALAVPVVQVVASGRLFRRGILLKSATALERLAEVDTVLFDKTGTVTLGRPALASGDYTDDDLRVAASIAAASKHPLARALVAAAPRVAPAMGAEEIAGHGMRLVTDDGEIRLGARDWVLPDDVDEASDGEGETGPEMWLSLPGRQPVRFAFVDAPRPDAAEVIAALRQRGMAVELLSGDREGAVRWLARRVGIDRFRARCLPQDKPARVAELTGEGRHVLMVGDGLNDAPALAAAHVSMSPATAAMSARRQPMWCFRAIGWMRLSRRWTSPVEPAGW